MRMGCNRGAQDRPGISRKVGRAGADQHHRICAGQPLCHRLAQGAGRQDAAIAEPGCGIDDDDGQILGQA